MSDSDRQVLEDNTSTLYPFTYTTIDDVRSNTMMAASRICFNTAKNSPINTTLTFTAPMDHIAKFHVMADTIPNGLTLTLTLNENLAYAATGSLAPTSLQLAAGDNIMFHGLVGGARYTIPITCYINPQQVESTGTVIIPIEVTN